MKPCRKCGAPSLPRLAIRGDYICLMCLREYQNAWLKRQRRNGYKTKRNPATERAYRLAYQATEHGKALRRASARRRLHDYPESRRKILSRAKLHQKVRSGKIVRQP